MDRWREYFDSAGADLWTICERAFAIAYLDNPHDFSSHRDRLAQKLFAPEKLDFELDGEHAPKPIPTVKKTTSDEGNGDVKQRIRRIHGSSDSDNDDDNDADENGQLRTPTNGNDNYDEAEALTDEMEEETLLKRDVFEIKETILDTYKSEREIFDALQRLELMQLSIDVIKETEIGVTVNSLRKHSSKRIRVLVKKLVSEWKVAVSDYWKSVEDVAAAARAGTMSVESPVIDDDEEDGLPSPPMDEGALLAGRTASIEMSQLFDFMDDDTSAGSGNPNNKYSSQTGSIKKSNGHMDAKHQHGERQDNSGKKKNDSDVRKKDRDSVTTSNVNSKKDKEAQTTACDSRRASYEKVEKKVQRSETSERQPVSGFSQRSQSKDSPELDQKILAAKRRLQENYQQVENAKRQRTIQVMELEELPKGGPKRAKAPQMVRGKLVSQHRPQAFGRR